MSTHYSDVTEKYEIFQNHSWNEGNVRIRNSLEFTESIFISVDVCLGHFVDAALQAIRGDLCSLGTVNEGLANVANIEHWRRLHIVPILTGEWVNTETIKRNHFLIFSTFFLIEEWRLIYRIVQSIRFFFRGYNWNSIQVLKISWR